jgi:hypothetical protein
MVNGKTTENKFECILNKSGRDWKCAIDTDTHKVSTDILSQHGIHPDCP